MKSRINNKLMVTIVTTLAPACALGVTAGVLISSIKPAQPQTLQTIVDKLNAKLANTQCKTMSQVLEATKSTYDIESAVLEDGQEFVWDQSVNMVAVMKGDSIKVWSEGYQPNNNLWQVWKMVDRDHFDSYNPYSQYLKQTSSNEETDEVYSVISGFDCGKNENVKNVHYFYEKMTKQIPKDIIINTCSKNTSVDVSAWDGNGSTGDTITHFGEMGELTVVTNHKYIENGKAITCSVYDGEITIEQTSNIEMTHVKASVTLTDFKQDGSLIDKIYAIPEVISEVQQQYPFATEATDTEYQSVKEQTMKEKGAEITYMFTASNSVNTISFNSLTDISNYSNDLSEKANDAPDRFFTGYTIVLNKDYDMAQEDGTIWKPICATTSTGKKKYEYNATAVQQGFAGTFDGNGHAILNMNLGTKTNPVTDETALFGGVNGTIKNLTIMDSNVNVKCADPTTEEGMRTCSGSLLAMAIGTKDTTSGAVTIENVHIVNSKLHCQYKSGLFAPYVQNANEVIVKDCSVDSDSELVSTCPTGTTIPAETGGGHGWFGHLSGTINKMTLTNCTNEANITGINCTSGFVGMYGSSANNLTFDHCTNKGDILTTAEYKLAGPQAAGFLGCINQTSQTVTTQIKLVDCVNEGYIDCISAPRQSSNNVWACGGYVGYVDNVAITGSTMEFENCVNKGQIGSETAITVSQNLAKTGGFIGRETSGPDRIVTTFKSCKNEGYIVGTRVGHFVALLENNSSVSCDSTCVISSGTLYGTADRTIITGEEQL